ncbi:MAG: hypothetical protein KME20_27150 [Kaiparowitsia implicata GSE-PSE-MK54-09C]|nr:hypothetical protein [Kaiparowitsia implicata GSE-PSE-MK54-09C]
MAARKNAGIPCVHLLPIKVGLLVGCRELDALVAEVTSETGYAALTTSLPTAF